jgi:hypothetical protein
VPPSERATISRFPQALNPKLDWVHSVIAKAVPSLALAAVWKLSYAMKDGLLPIAGEKSGLIPRPASRSIQLVICTSLNRMESYGKHPRAA